MTDDMIRSMKNQMVPSDDVVNDLLAKIAALEASPENMDNVVTFDESRFARPEIRTEKPSKAKTTKKSIWLYGTAAAASALVLLSTFAMFGDDADIGDHFDDIVDNPGIVTDITNVGENTPDPAVIPPVDDPDNTDEPDKADQPDPVKQDDKNNKDDKDNEVINPDEDDKDNESGKNTESKEGTQDSTQTPDKSNNSDNTEDNSQDAEEDTSIVTPPPAGDEDPKDGTVEVDDSKVTPGAPGASDISWQREILAESSVSNITIQGTNYVVESVASSPSVASTTEVQKISLEIPATATTNHTTVEAKVKSVKDVSTELMVAVDAEGFKETLLYTNVDYKPETLGQYISDSGLSSKNIAFAKAVTCQVKGIGKTDTKRVNVSEIDALIKQYILGNADAPLAKKADYDAGTSYALFRTSKNPTQAVINFGVSSNGYLYVKLTSGNSFTFHIGEQQAKSFISCITGA